MRIFLYLVISVVLLGCDTVEVGCCEKSQEKTFLNNIKTQKVKVKKSSTTPCDVNKVKLEEKNELIYISKHGKSYPITKRKDILMFISELNEKTGYAIINVLSKDGHPGRVSEENYLYNYCENNIYNNELLGGNPLGFFKNDKGEDGIKIIEFKSGEMKIIQFSYLVANIKTVSDFDSPE